MIIHLVNSLDNIGAFTAQLPERAWRVALVWWPLVVATLLVWGVVRVWWARVYRVREAAQAVWVQISPPPMVGPNAGERFARSLEGVLRRTRRTPIRARQVACEFVADDAGMRIGVWVPPAVTPDAVAEAIKHAWPGARTAMTSPPTLTGRGGVCAREVMPRAGEWTPLTDPSGHHARPDVDTADPLGLVLSMLADRGPGETAVAQVIVTPQRQTSGRGLSARGLDGMGSLLSQVAAEVLDLVQPGPVGRSNTATTPRNARADDPVKAARLRAVVAKKAAGPHLRVTVRVAVTGPIPVRYRRGAVSGITNGYDAVATTGDGLRSRRVPGAEWRAATRRPGTGFVATTAELAAFWHLPVQGGAYGIETHPARLRAPRRDLPLFPTHPHRPQRSTAHPEDTDR